MHGERSPGRAPNGALSKLTTLLLMIPGEPGGTAQNHALRKYVAEQPATMAESVLRGEDYGLIAEGATDEDIIYLARTGAKELQGGRDCGKDPPQTRTDIYETQPLYANHIWTSKVVDRRPRGASRWHLTTSITGL